MLLWHLSALSLTEYSRVDKGAGADGGNGRSLCYDHTSGANHRGTIGNNGQLAGANPTNSGIYLLDRCITSCPTLPDPAGQYHTIAFPMPEKHDTRITCTHIKERYRPLFLLPLDIHTSGIAYRIRDQRNNHAWRDSCPPISLSRCTRQRDYVYFLLVQSLRLADETGSQR